MNIWNFTEPYARRQALLRRGVRELDPDLLAFQEAGFAGGRHQVAEALEGLGYHLLHQLEVKSDSRWDQGCCVASRWPIEPQELLAFDLTEHTHRYPYAALAVRVAAPDPVGRLLFVCAKPSWELSREYERELQAVELVKLVRRHTAASDFPPIIAGDFDAAPDRASVRFLTGRQSLAGISTCLRDAWAEAGDGSPGYTWTSDNPGARQLIEKRLFEKRHARRIDYIFMGSFHDYSKFARIARCRVVLNKPVNGIWPSDHYAVCADIDVLPPLG
jgi:endonuclease/exonuclease/phosphatase family metal-dependent hydrolase